ncbi:MULTISPECIES: KAP family P-loop NTPase fold protein [Pseudomonas]|uniref:KAP family P-loop NTPase fold protein n=1 Tax=Pseudomonas TaxID=286 RepID=UPI00093613E0|nr:MULTISPECIES: P-loop NTPase fold protein [Pseudomonas]OJT50960.1 P-loop ATPase [Pseudomonas moraviensis]
MGTYIEGEPWALDQMNRKGVAKFLTQYLDATPKINVLNVNSAWGSGKTFFLKNWVAEQSSDRACVYFNAWETDFSGDAFVSLVATIKDQLHDVIGPLQEADNLIKKFTSKASKTLIAATPALAKGVVKKFTGVDIGLFSEVADSDALADAAEKAVEKLIETNKETLAIVEDFKKVFHELVVLSSRQLAAGGTEKPVYIFIDELDRCRPTFAIELLERIKHLFEVSGCKFIIATDTLQLSHSIRAVYGTGFASEKYLKRFFDAEFTLDNTDIGAWVKANFTYTTEDAIVGLNNIVEVGRTFSHFDAEPVKPDPQAILSGPHQLNQHQAVILALALTFKSKLRELEKISMQINAVRTNCKSNGFHLFWAAYLVFLKDESPDLYEMAIRGDYTNALRQIEKIYNGKILYFLISNISIHEIFSIYLTRYREGKESARQSMHRASGSELGYIDRANSAFYSEFEQMRNYTTLVELAHSIE